uniref:Uncharacterized protein n=1 Tax=Corethron hystrix TaxID=216773 RepID=A0A7S1BUX6_9STRA|mmetsp:Transcript_42063/g.98565  ORF Transcript_42063/g.98565 Transcript_42063/m.98565 type:complete len:255 (+) Transcript_42063:239-1003(+)
MRAAHLSLSWWTRCSLPCTASLAETPRARYVAALSALPSPSDEDHDHHGAFLRDAVRYTDLLGSVRHGDPRVHAALSRAAFDGGRWQEGVTHGVYAEEPQEVARRLQKDVGLREEGEGPAGDRPADVALTVAVTMFLALENMRDATQCVRTYLEEDDRPTNKLTSSFLTSKSNTNYVTFCTSLISICETENKQWFHWLTGGSQCGKKLMDQNKGLVPYITKIGKVYFNVQPPPTMMSMMENMMGMMGGMGGMGM